MKKTTIIIATCFAMFLASQAQAKQYIISYSQNRADEVKAEVTRVGGQVLSEFEIINAVVAEIPEDKLQQTKSLKGVKTVEEDLVINWISSENEELRSSIEIPTLSQVLSSIKENKIEIPMPASEVEMQTRDSNAYSEIPWGIQRVNAPQAWNFTQGAGVKVAVVDTGINYKHEDLSGNYISGYNAVDTSKTALDDQGHGTHVAGTIAALSNGKGVVGVAPRAKLYAVKVLGADGSGSYSSIIKGIEWAAKNKMNVINMSLGGGGYMSSMHEAVKAAVKAGVTVVCAAGNDSGAVNYPAKYPEAIAVSASNSSDQIAYFSSRGAELDVIAPGVDIYSTSISGGYQNMSGTSMACPHVAGLAALAVSAGYKTPAEVRAALKKAAVPLTGLTANEQGAGLVNAAKLKK